MASPERTKVQALADLDAARRRSDLWGLDRHRSDVPYVGDPGDAAVQWRELSRPVVTTLIEQLDDSPVAVVLADRDGRIIDRHASRPDTLKAMDSHSLDVGYSLAEDHVGTNGVGTSLESRRPTLVVGDQHYLEAFQSFACAHAPVVDPLSGRVEGTIGVVCPVDATNSLLLTTATQLAHELARLRAEQSSPTEKFLLQQFLGARRSTNQAIATIGDGVFIGTPRARRLLEGTDHGRLWSQIERIARGSAGESYVVRWPDQLGRSLEVRCLPAYQGGELDGATLDIRTPAPKRSRSGTRRMNLKLPGLVGSTPLWQTVVGEAHTAATTPDPVLVVGEQGTGRLAIARAIATEGGADSTTECDCSLIVVDGVSHWLQQLRLALRPSSATILQRVELLPADAAAAVFSLLRDAPQSAKVIATCGDTDHPTLSASGLIHQVDVFRVDVPPLRERRDDIPALVEHFSRQAGAKRVDPEVMPVLYRQAWPGNIAELLQTLRAAFARAGGATVTTEHLPGRLRMPAPRTPLHGLRQREAAAIVEALNHSANRTEAARLLGISRATLYRRIAAYGLDA